MRTSCFSLMAMLLIALCSCSGKGKRLEEKIIGRYFSVSENEYDHFKDTMEIRRTDDGKYDVTQIANWSSAKKSDPTRPNRNKVAGEWINYGKGDTFTGSFQMSDTTLRITDPMSGSVEIIRFDVDEGLMYYPVRNSFETYTKIKD